MSSSSARFGTAGRWIAAAMVITTACGGGDAFENASTCDEVGAAAIGEVQVLLDDLADVSVDELTGVLDPTTETPAVVQEFDQDLLDIGRRSERRADEIGCPFLEVNAYYLEHLPELTAEGPVAELALRVLTAGQ